MPRMIEATENNKNTPEKVLYLRKLAKIKSTETPCPDNLHDPRVPGDVKKSIAFCR